VEIKNRQKMLLFAAAAGLFLLVADSLILSPLTASWQARSKRIAELKKSVADGSLLIKRKEAILGRWDRMRTNTLPSNVSLAEGELLKAVNRWAQDSGITLVSLKPQWKESGEDYITLECRADASGDIRTVSRFLYDLEKEPMGLKVETVEISARDNEGQQLSLGLQLSGLLLNSPEP
jgi:Tfp pilus assembly protein PilO